MFGRDRALIIFPWLMVSSNINQRQNYPREKTIDTIKSTPENILALFLRILQHESAGRKFNFPKWQKLTESDDILNCDQYFD